MLPRSGSHKLVY